MTDILPRSIARPGIRVIALCVLRRDDTILVERDYDRVLQQTYYRPPGGGLLFGERAADAVRREMREELGVELGDLQPLGVLENLFVFEDEPGHEIVFVFAARALDDALYRSDAVALLEDDGSRHVAEWQHLDRLAGPDTLLYPPGLLSLIPEPPR